jgi:protease IV
MLQRRTCLALLLALSALALAAGPARAAEEPTPVVAHIRLAGDLDEAPVSADALFGTAAENYKSKLDRLAKARKDPNVKAVYLEIDGVGIGWAKLDELTQAIQAVRNSGKKVFAYVESGEPKDYLLALACDEVCLPESGWLMLTGLRAEVTFYKDLFDKLGVQADMLWMGDFKSAVEPYTRNGMSESAKKQLKLVLDDRFDHGIVERVVKSRPKAQLTAAQVEKLIDGAPYTAKTALKLGLIDRVAYEDEFRDSFKETLKLDKLKVEKNYEKTKVEQPDLSTITGLMKLLSPPKTRESKEPKVAVIYVTGVISTGRSGFSLLGGETCGSTTIIEAIRQAEEDKTVKAIVLRVDSPGGSALASDLIWHELRRCKKPVIASMSDVAASGGYYVCMGTEKIYAEPGTLTGSIGVFGGKIVYGDALGKVGLKTEVLSRGANANILSTATPFSESERRAMTALIRDVYDQFLDKAVEGRARAGKKIDREKLDKDLAGGRVWTGRQALAHGLVDEMGGLDEAVAAAWKAAKMPEDKQPELLLLPKSKGFLDRLLDGEAGSQAVGSALLKEPELKRKLAPAEAMLRLRGEPAWMVMPFGLEVK